jgi:hypothetical protein
VNQPSEPFVSAYSRDRLRTITMHISARRLPARHLAIIVCFSVLAILYLEYTTAGTGQFHTGRGYYDALAEGFLAGHLYLPDAPNPALLTLADAYDPLQNGALRLHDASLYNGRYYLYWGPFPGLAHLLWIVASGGSVPDEIPTAAAGTFAVAAFWRLISDVRSMYAPSAPLWFPLLSTLGLAFGGIYLYLLGRPSIYHEPLLFASALVFGSFVCLNRALFSSHRRSWYLPLAGCLLGAAVASRITYVGYCIGALVVLVILVVESTRHSWRVAVRNLLALGTPIAATAVILGLYNFVRFGSVFEFGLRYQLHGSLALYEAFNIPGGGGIRPAFDLSTLPTEVLVYLLSWPEMSLGWPYFSSSPVGFAFPHLKAPPALLMEMPILSVAALYPMGLLGVIAPVTLLWRRGRPAAWTNLIITVSIGALSTLLIIAAEPGMTARYLVDFGPVFYFLGFATLMWVAYGGRTENGVVETGRSRIGCKWNRVLATCAITSVTISGIVSIALDATSFRYSVPTASAAITATSNQFLSWLVPTFAPWSLPSALELNGPLRPETWNAEDGHYANGAPVVLRAPSDEPAVAIIYDTDKPLVGPLQLWVNGSLAKTNPAAPPGWWFYNLEQEIAVAVLPGVHTGDVVELKLIVQELSDQHASLPVVLRAIALSRGPGDSTLLSLAEHYRNLLDLEHQHSSELSLALQEVRGPAPCAGHPLNKPC